MKLSIKHLKQIIKEEISSFNRTHLTENHDNEPSAKELTTILNTLEELLARTRDDNVRAELMKVVKSTSLALGKLTGKLI